MLRAARRYIARDNPAAAKQIASRIRAAVKHLADHPEMGRPGRIVGTRELVVPKTPYIVAYRVRGEVIEILSVMHGAQEWPQELE
jgi:addiction module RelE/StbE family toxin